MNSPEAILVAVQFGLELGLTPMQALQNVAVVNGRPAVWGDAQLGLCMSSPLFDQSQFSEWFEGTPFQDSFTAYCRVKRVNRKEVTIRSFSVADAKQSGLWSKKDTPWVTYPRRMLQMRARSFALRDAFPDLLKGVMAAEEAMDIPAVECTPQRGADGNGGSGVAALAAKLNLAETQPAKEEAVQAVEEAEVEQETLF
jgi:hypothetical protein